MRTAVFDGFLDEFVRYAVEVDFEAPVLLAPDAFDGFVCGSRSGPLMRATALPVLPTPVVELVGGPKRVDGRYGDVGYPEVHIEDCSVLGIGFRVVGFEPSVSRNEGTTRRREGCNHTRCVR